MQQEETTNDWPVLDVTGMAGKPDNPAIRSFGVVRAATFGQRANVMLRIARAQGLVLLAGMVLFAMGCESAPSGSAPVPVAPALPANGAKPGPVDADAPTEFTETPSGLKYRIRRKADGRKPTPADTVRVDYHGWLDNGTVFDSSYKRSEPISFPLNGVIAGWTEGLQLIGEGGMIELEIPYQLGYGEEGNPPNIPPRATLHFIVELRRVL